MTIDSLRVETVADSGLVTDMLFGITSTGDEFLRVSISMILNDLKPAK